MIGKIVLFPISPEWEVASLLGTLTFADLIEVRGQFISYLYQQAKTGDGEAIHILKDLEKKSVIEQVALICRLYPECQTWIEKRRKES